MNWTEELKIGSVVKLQAKHGNFSVLRRVASIIDGVMRFSPAIPELSYSNKYFIGEFYQLTGLAIGQLSSAYVLKKATLKDNKEIEQIEATRKLKSLRKKNLAT